MTVERYFGARVAGMVAAGLLLAGCGSGSGQSDPANVRSDDHLVSDPSTTGQYVADSGFRPDPDGFSFPNYGDDPGVAGLGAAQLVELFGQQACLTPSGAACRLGSPATTWLQVMNNAAAAGHCEGMAALSQVFAAGEQSPSEYGAENTFGLPFDGNQRLQRDIARWFSTQATEPTQGSELRGKSPVEILDLLIEALPAERTPENTYTLGIFQPEFEGGHAITPYAVEDRGDGVFWIMVYDNNFPGESRALAVDRKTEAWSYLASTNPEEPEAVYVGDKHSGTLTLTALAPRLVQQECPFCRGELDDEVAESGTNQFSLTGAAAQSSDTDFYLTDAADQRLGRVTGRLVRDVPDGRIIPLSQGPGVAPAPFLEAPASLDTTVTIVSQEESTALDFAMIGAGYDVLISGVNAPDGATAQVRLAADGSRVTYSQKPVAGPNMSVAVENAEGYVFDLNLDIVRMVAEDASITIASPDETADVVVGSPTAGRYSLSIDVVGPDDSERQLVVAEFDLASSQQVVLNFEQWRPGGPLQADVINESGEVVGSLQVTETTPVVPRPL